MPTARSCLQPFEGIVDDFGLHDAFDRVRAMAGQPRVMPPGQSALDEILATVVAA